MRRKWSDSEIQFLKKNWGIMPFEQITGTLERSNDSVLRKARRLGLDVRKKEEEKVKRKWKPEEDAYILENYKREPTAEISRHLRRTEPAIRKRALYLGVAGEMVRWSEKEEEFLKEKWGILNLDTIAKKLNRSKNSVVAKAYQMSLREQVTANGAYLTPSNISGILNVNIRTLYTWIRKGLIKYRRFKVGRKTKYQITIDSFCRFLEGNRDKWNSNEADIVLIKMYLVSYSIAEDGNLILKENSSKWLDEKIKADKQGYRKLLKPWTTNEEKMLLHLIDKGLTYSDIGAMLGRSVGSVKSRVYLLRDMAGLKYAGAS
jgi:hypothetical protein